MDLLSDLIIEPNLAPIKYRVFAALIDFGIVFLVCYAMGYFFGESYITPEGGSGVRITGLPGLALFVMLVLLMPVQEGLTGRTVGKWLVSIKVVKDDLSDSSVGTSIVRHLFDLVDMFLFIGLIVASSNPKKQRVGDLVARTVVVIG